MGMSYDDFLRDLADDTARVQVARTLARQLLKVRDALREIQGSTGPGLDGSPAQVEWHIAEKALNGE